MRNLKEQIKKIRGPIAIYGAGGFVGFNLLQKILRVRNDVFGVFSDPKKNWRLKKLATPPQHVVKCNLLDRGEASRLISRMRPKTVFNLAAYGAYSAQKDIDRIYQTNFNSTYALIEELKKYGFSVYVHAGSQSEYGLNCAGPSEEDELIPNSHYATSKTAVSYLVKYYGKVEKLPVVHLRLYSVYGPWEEPDRLIPTLVREAKRGRLPKFVDPNISRDFVYVEDVIEAFIVVAERICHSGLSRIDSGVASLPRMTRQMLKRVQHDNLYGGTFNIASGKKTTIKQLAYLARRLFKIKEEPKFGTMKNRGWDLKDWYGNPKKIKKVFGWRAKTSLEAGLMNFYRESSLTS